MKIISNKKNLIKITNSIKNLGFVPTMGAIHKGHLSLVEASNKKCKKTLVSIFINKPQFNRKKDFQKYPRTMKKDIKKLKKYKVDYLFVPSFKEMYPNGINKKIKVISFAKELCGKFRPRHFEAIADIIDRFIKVAKPKKIFLGEKDMQQLKIIDAFVRRNYPKVKVIGCKTVREKNGTAISSRNILLSGKEKIIASNIYKFMKKNKRKILTNKIKYIYVKKILSGFGVKKIDYIKTLDVNKIINSSQKKKKLRVFIAYYLRSTRLIDNI